MKELLERRELAELAIAVALGYALYRVAAAVGQTLLQVIAELVVDAPDDTVEGLLESFGASPQFLYFEIGDTPVFYGYLLGAILSLGLLVSILGMLRGLQTLCPYCRTPVPRLAPVCRNCSLETAPPDDQAAAPEMARAADDAE